jgi:hypothetical protein
MPRAPSGAAIPAGGAVCGSPSPDRPQSAGNRPVAGPFRFQVQNRLISSPLLRTAGTAARWPSWLPYQGLDPVHREALLVAAETSSRVTEGPGDLGLCGIL